MLLNLATAWLVFATCVTALKTLEMLLADLRAADITKDAEMPRTSCPRHSHPTSK